MAIAWVLGIIFALCVCGTVALAIWCAVKYADEETVGWGVGKWISAVFVVGFFLLLLFVPGSFHQVNAGEVAVVKHLGDIKKVRGAGTYFDFWITEKYDKYDAKVQTLDITESAYSKDAQTMDIQMTVQYSIKTDYVTKIAEEYGSLDALSSRIRSIAVEKTKSVLSKHKAMNDTQDNTGIIENREAVGVEVTDTVKTALDGFYVNVSVVALTNIDFTDAFERVVEEKMIAEQEKLKAQYEKEKAIIEAEKELEVAKLAAQARIAEAEGNAEAQRVFADAEAYATQIKIVELARAMGYKVEQTAIQETRKIKNEKYTGEDDEPEYITELVDVGTQYEINWKEGDAGGKELIIEYLKYLEYLAKWDGKLPEVVAGDSGLMFTYPAESSQDNSKS